MSVELQSRMSVIAEGTQDATTQASLILAGMVNGDLISPAVAKAIADALNTVRTTNDPVQWLTGILAEAAVSGTFGGSGSGGVSQAAFDAEVLARETGDTALGASVTAETIARQSADSSEAATRSGADSAEAVARSSADSAEAATRFSEDSALDVRVTALELVPIIVRTEAELLAALAISNVDILIPGITLVINAKLVPSVAGVRVRGLGMGNTRILASSTFSDDRMVHPSAADMTFSDLTLNGGVNRPTGVYLDGFSRGADRNTFQRVKIESVLNGIVMSGGPASSTSDYLTDFSFLQSRIEDFDNAGIYLAWEILRLRIQDFFIWGNGAASAHNAIWLGLGMLDCHILTGVCGNVNRNGVELFYPSAGITLSGQPGPAHISVNNPYGPAMQVANVIIAQTGGFGASFAGCKRSQIHHINIRDAVGIGCEFVDQDTSAPCNLAASHINVTHCGGTGVSIDQIVGLDLSEVVIDGIYISSGVHRGLIILNGCDDVTIRGCTLTGCGPRYLLVINSTRVNIFEGNKFIAKTGEDFSAGDPEGGNFAVYFYCDTGPGDVYFNGNIIRGNGTNPLHSAYNGATVMTSPTSAPLTGYDPNFTDPDNYRP